MVQLGAKTLIGTLKDTPTINTKNIDTELDPLLRRMWDILEELNRRTFDVGSLEVLPNQAFSNLYIAVVESESGGEVTYKSLSRYNLTTETLEEISTSGKVRELIDTFHGEDTLLENDKVLCWLISKPDDDTPKYVGIQFFGRSTIGLP